jgi:subtilisin family serine protease
MKHISLLIALSILGGCAKGNKDNKTSLVPKREVKTEEAKPSVADSLKTQIKKLNQFPVFTVIMVPKKDVQGSIAALKKGGAKLVYDPNNGFSSTIPFYIASLTPDQINNETFIGSLGLKAATIEAKETNKKPIETKLDSGDLEFTNFIPTESVGINDLGVHAEMGAGTTVAVIDTGIDASHPAFGDRVVYWYDATEETKTELTKVKVVNSTAEISVNDETKKVILPKNLPKGEVYMAVMDETNFTAQLGAAGKKEGFLDLNYNKASDTFVIAAIKTAKGIKVLFDENADLKFSTESELKLKIDYNKTTKKNRKMGMVDFPSRNNIISYPILLTEEDKKLFIGLGKTEGMHGTHVAGIIAADDKKNNLVGAAPKADLMSLKVCSGISCTDSAIIKALYKTFYNGKVIPDVVNISLGSPEGDSRDVYSHLFDDLSAKFGTVFFISASNSGPGFRSLNHLGNSGSVVMVGANVSADTLRDQYNLPGNSEVYNESLLFFSSLGPSYTGEMKPNIVAPGAAISAVPAAENYMSQANGTSMSSPMAAGAMAAVLGKVKADIPGSMDTIAKIRKANLKGVDRPETTLLPYVYAMKDALQGSAEFLADLSMAQQGYGLIKADKAFTLLGQYVQEINNSERDYFEIVLNDYKKGYDRSGKVSKLNAFKLSIGADGERSKESLASIIANGVDVVLAKVEELGTDGTLTAYEGGAMADLFYIVSRGDSAEKLMNTHVTFNNRRTPNFYSKRVLKNMTLGNTYLAHYKVMYQGVNVGNILDVVHRPFKLKERTLKVPAIDPMLTKVKSGFGVKDIAIKTNTFHRYPIYVDGKTHKINVKLSPSVGAEGRMYLQLYNPEGREVTFEVAQNSVIHPYKMAEIDVTTKKNGKIQKGIWEITVSTSSSDWLADSKYDLLVMGDKFGAEKATYETTLGNELVIPVQTGGASVDKVIMTGLVQLHKQKVAVKAAHVSFHPLMLPKGFKGKISASINDKTRTYWGKMLDSLYVLKGKKFVKYAGKASAKSGTIMIKEETAEQLYFGLDTIRNFGDSSSDVVKEVEVITEYAIDMKVDLTLSHEAVSSMGIELIKVNMTSADVTALEGEAAFIKGTINVISGKVEEVTDHQGNVILNIADDAKITPVKIIVKK